MRPKTNTGIDFIALSIYLALVMIGWAMIYTVGSGQENYSEGFFSFINTPVGKQLIWVGISFVVFILTFAVDSKFWRTFSNIIYALGIFLLIAVLIFGKTIKGATSWFVLPGGMSLQPSEFAKFATCLALASYLSSYAKNLRTNISRLYAMAFFFGPMLLILLQPDAGSAMVFLGFFVVLYREGFPGGVFVLGFSVAAIFLAGLVTPTPIVMLVLATLGIIALVLDQEKNKLRWAAGAAAIIIAAGFTISEGYLWETVGAISAIVLGFCVWQYFNRLKPQVSLLVGTAYLLGSLLAFGAGFCFNEVLKFHQQQRILVWLKPSEADPQGAAYNLLNSKMAISSGDFLGKGFLQGNLTQGNFVPEQITDFIFCAVGEEQGFLGVTIIIILFLTLLWRIIFIAERQRSDFNRLYAYGVASILFIHFFINIGMTMGLMPIIGIPLPFLSKGGSSLVVFSLMIAVLLKLDSTRT